MDVLLQDLAAALGLGDDPRITYSLAAALLLGLVSLLSGLGRLDVAALFRPANLLRLCVGVGLAFGVVLAADLLVPATDAGAAVKLGVARLPLYVLALAYGPSSGLLAGALFAGATAVGPYPGWTEAILMLELTILGWLAIAPSPRRARWAGPASAGVAYALALGTAGVAFFVWRHGQFDLGSLLAEQAAVLPGLLIAWVLLGLLSPRYYARRLPHSRIAPRARQRTAVRAPAATGAPQALVRTQRAVTATAELQPLEKMPRKRSRRLPDPEFSSDDPNG